LNETELAVRKFQKELKSGTVALVLLSILDRSSDSMYGYQITKHIESGLPDGPWISQGALYPVLRSLEKGGLLESEVEPSTSGPPRRYYRITGVGRETLEAWRGTWEETRDFVDSILKGKDDVEDNQ
jgi:PadR family transcriptional regulator PadR